MNRDELAERTRLQVERAQRAAEEARRRVKASRGGALRLPPGEEDEAKSESTGAFLQYFSGD